MCNELSKGKLVLDGRRSLCALRRMLEFMLRRRGDMHEQVRVAVDGCGVCGVCVHVLGWGCDVYV